MYLKKISENHIDTLNKKRGENLKIKILRENMERVRVNPFVALAAIWKDKPEVELEGEQEEVLAKLAPREALELSKSLKRANNMAGKMSLEKSKNDFKSSNKVKKGQIKNEPKVQNIEKENIEKEIVD